jgi:predicted ribosomally synthesized peptide with SipW-like signal peptide
MKKKVLSIALVIVLLAILVSGSLAYFTAEDQVTNTITIGSVLIEIWENDEPTDTDVMEFDEPLVPVVDMNDLVNDPGYIPKVVKVENTGANAAYIRTHIAVPATLVDYLELKVNTAGWDVVGFTSATVDNVDYLVVTYDYQTAVNPGNFTGELLQGAYLLGTTDLRDNPDTPEGDLEFCRRDSNGEYIFSGFVAHKAVNGGYASQTVSILVASQAIQYQGFENSTATEALNTGFGANTNPWA